MSQHGPHSKRQAQHEAHILPVTALAYLNDDVVLAGEGSFLCAYEEHSQTLLGSWRILLDHAVHGIVVDTSSSDVLVYGGRSLKIIQLRRQDDANLDLTILATLAIDDWILDASFESSRAALITAHNALLMVERSNEAWKVIPQIPGSNTILYSAHIQQTSKDRWLVAAGTAFGDVLLWSYVLAEQTSTRTIHYSFSAHEGSTFGVRISELIRSGGYARLLASCSDDRTVRVWDISDLSSATSEIISNRSTGFGSTTIDDSGRPTLIAKAMGHFSRIWHVRFDHTVQADLLIRSFGEDATTITWELQPASTGTTPYTLVQRSVRAANAGKHIWSVATSATGQFIVGGGDGAIACISTKRAILGKEITSPDSDILKVYTFLDESTLVATTRGGQVAIFNLQPELTLIRSFKRSDLANYSVIASASGVAFIGGTGPAIYAHVQGTSDLLPVPCSQGKIAALLSSVVVDTDPTDIVEIAVLLTKMQESSASLILLHKHDVTLTVVSNVKYDLPRGFQVTSSTHIHLDDTTLLSVLGSRDGRIALSKHARSAEMNHFSACSVVSVHAEAVTSMLWLSKSRSRDANHAGHLVTISRDGTFAINRVRTASDESPTVDLKHQLELPFGPNIEGLALLHQDDLHIWGFRNKHFVVYSVKQQREIFTIDCGGAHRAWDIWLNNERLAFAWTKASKVSYAQLHQDISRLISVGGHGREIKSMALYNDRKGSSLVATGAQDTDIRLFTVPQQGLNRQTQLTCTHILRQHNTGPQHLAFSDNGTYLFSSGGFEEFFVWRLTPDCPLLDIGVVCESIHPRCGKSDLRITHFEAQQQENALHIAMTYSDSRITIWSYHRTQGWNHLVEADYLTSCLTSIFAGTNTRFWTAATDGHIAEWQYGHDQFTWIKRHQAHQGAVLCSVLHDQLMITGGDDNAISFTWLGSCTTKSIRRAHAAAVTALHVATLSQGNTYLISAGLDQRLILWELIPTEARARKLQVVSSCVADISAIGQLPSEDGIRIVVSGIGMEIWTISLPA